MDIGIKLKNKKVMLIIKRAAFSSIFVCAILRLEKPELYTCFELPTHPIKWLQMELLVWLKKDFNYENL